MIKCRLAVPADDERLRILLRAEPLPGAIRLQFTREPNFFESLTHYGRSHQVIVVEDGGEICGLLVRSRKEVLFQGAPVTVGYLHSLRIRASSRSGLLFARLAAFLRELHGDGMCKLYLISVPFGAGTAKDLLTSGRYLLPAARSLGTLYTYLLPLKTAGQYKSPDGIIARAAQAGDLSEIEALEGRFIGTRGLSEMCNQRTAERTYVVFRNGRLRGVLQATGPDSDRQTVVKSHPWSLRLLRAGHNLLSPLTNFGPIPGTGECIRICHASNLMVDRESADLLPALIGVARYAEGEPGRAHFLALGVHALDPLRSELRFFYKITYATGLFLMYWDDGRDLATAYDRSALPHFDISRL